MARIILDASVALKLLLEEQGAEAVEEQFDSWRAQGTEVCVPILFFSEVMNGIQRRVHRRLLTEAEGDQVLEALKLLRATPLPTPLPFEQAWGLAKTYNLSTTYDAEYLALAQREGCDFWTVDQNLLNVLGEARPAWVKEMRS